MCQFLSCYLQALDQYFVMRKNVMGVARNCESMGRAKWQGGATDCPPYYWMADMEIREGKKRRKNCSINRHEHGHPTISKFEILEETAAWRNNWKVVRSTEGGSTSDKCSINGGSSGVNVRVTGLNLFCKVQTRQWKRMALFQDIQKLGVRNSWIESERRWLDCVVLKPRSRFQKFGGK